MTADLLLSNVLIPGKSINLTITDFDGEQEFKTKDGTQFKKYRYRFTDNDGRYVVHYATESQHRWYLRDLPLFSKVTAYADHLKKGKFTFERI